MQWVTAAVRGPLMFAVLFSAGLVYAQDPERPSGVEERGIPQMPPRAPAMIPVRVASQQVMNAYRAVLAQPAVRAATQAEIQRQISVIPPVAFVNGYWVSLVNVSSIYAQPGVRTALTTALQQTPGGLQAIDQVIGGQTDYGIVLTGNQFNNILRIPTQDITNLIGVRAIMGDVGGIAGPSHAGMYNVFSIWGYITDAFNWLAGLYQNWQADRQNKKCKDKGPQGDCDGDGDKNETDPCPFDPNCKSNSGSFVGCIIITCQSFTSTFGRELNTTLDQVFNEMRQSGQTGSVVPLGQAVAGQINMGVVLPAVIR